MRPHSAIYSGGFLTAFRFRRRLEIAAALLKPHFSPETRMLDLGCGDGAWLRYIASCIGTGTGVDVGWSGAENAWSSHPPNISFKKGDFLSYSFPDAPFDVVCCFETLEHMAEPGEAIRIIHQSLKKDGIAVISVPLEVGPSLIVKEAIAYITKYRRSIDKSDHWKFRELFPALIYNIDGPKKARNSFGNPGHKGFDYRDVEKIFRGNFRNVVCRGTPFPVTGKLLNVGVIYLGWK